MDEFVHLENRSAFSFLWGTYSPEDLVERIAGLGQTAVALTDDGLHGAVRFSRAATRAGLQPIFGAKIKMEEGWPLTLLVRSQTGYANLCRLLSISQAHGLLPDRKIAWSELARHGDGLICLAGGWGAPLGERLIRGGWEPVRHWFCQLKKVFPGRNRIFVVLQNQGLAGQLEGAGRVRCLARQMGLPVVATNGNALLSAGDYLIHQTLVGIQKNHHHRKIDPLPGPDFFPLSQKEMGDRLPFPEALANTGLIARLCRDFSLPEAKGRPPCFPGREGSRARLAAICRQELSRRLARVPPEYAGRLDRELSIVGRLGLAHYFLLVRDVVSFARERGIRHSVRGSAAGSLLVFLLLGGVDPVAHDLLFERFINQGRRDLPDVDLDFDSERRDEVLHYILEKFPEQTALVATVHTLKVRSAVRLSARALGFSPREIKGLMRGLPLTLEGIDLETALRTWPELAQSPLKKQPVLVSLAARLADLPFQSSVHLGGVLIAPGNIHDFTPVATTPRGFPVAHLDKDDAENLGLLKLDILGLRMHTAIGKAVEFLARENVFLEPESLPLDDKKVFAMLGRTESLGVFQIESPGQRQLLGRLDPGNFADLIAEISLFRPGPVEGNLVDPYIRRKNGEEEVVYPHPELKSVLQETFGLILYQEQVLRVVNTFAGLSFSEADAFRRVMTKDRRNRDMKRLKQHFVQGAMSRGHSARLAVSVWEQVLTLAAYGFCKAHAACFAHLTYQSAYLKAHHPRSFFLGLLNAGRVGTYSPAVILNEARRSGIQVLAPHVNAGGLEYLPEGNGLRAPLTVIRGVGPALAARIVEQREKKGVFGSREDFLGRVPLPERIIKVLTQAGALEGLTVQATSLFPLESHG